MFIAVLGPSYAVTRRAASAPEQSGLLTRSAARLGALTGISTLLVVALLAMFALPHDKSFLWPLCIAAALILPLEHTRLFLLAVDRGTGQYSRYNFNVLLTAALFPIALGVAWFLGAKSIWLVVLLTFAGPLVGLIFRLHVERTPRLFRGTRVPRPMTLFREGASYFVSVTTSDLFGRLDAMLFLWLGSFTAQGYYAAAVASSTLLLVAPNALAIFTFNRGAERKVLHDGNSLLLAIGAMLGFQIATAAAFAVVLRPLIRLIYGAEFLGAVPLALAPLPAQAFNGFGVVIDGYLAAAAK